MSLSKGPERERGGRGRESGRDREMGGGIGEKKLQYNPLSNCHVTVIVDLTERSFPYLSQTLPFSFQYQVHLVCMISQGSWTKAIVDSRLKLVLRPR